MGILSRILAKAKQFTEEYLDNKPKKRYTVESLILREDINNPTGGSAMSAPVTARDMLNLLRSYKTRRVTSHYILREKELPRQLLVDLGEALANFARDTGLEGDYELLRMIECPSCCPVPRNRHASELSFETRISYYLLRESIDSEFARLNECRQKKRFNLRIHRVVAYRRARPQVRERTYKPRPLLERGNHCRNPRYFNR